MCLRLGPNLCLCPCLCRCLRRVCVYLRQSLPGPVPVSVHASYPPVSHPLGDPPLWLPCLERASPSRVGKEKGTGIVCGIGRWKECETRRGRQSVESSIRTRCNETPFDLIRKGLLKRNWEWYFGFWQCLLGVPERKSTARWLISEVRRR